MVLASRAPGVPAPSRKRLRECCRSLNQRKNWNSDRSSLSWTCCHFIEVNPPQTTHSGLAFLASKNFAHARKSFDTMRRAWTVNDSITQLNSSHSKNNWNKFPITSLTLHNWICLHLTCSVHWKRANGASANTIQRTLYCRWPAQMGRFVRRESNVRKLSAPKCL